MSELILTRDAGAIRYLTMNRPDKLNAMNDALVGQLATALRTAEADRDVAVIVLTGAGRAFCAGADLGSGAPAGANADGKTSGKATPTGAQIVERLDNIIRFYGTIQRMDTPVIAAVQGYAMGGGCNLAVSCDLVVAADNAMFG
ncbi:MAG: enoyl-CoA hydratase/isomerase family protein, partial [Porticoccaceae bacterium]